MTPEERLTWEDIVESCDSTRWKCGSINVGTLKRRAVILEVAKELVRLENRVQELIEEKAGAGL